MKKHFQSMFIILITLSLVLISCRLLTPAPAPEPAPGADVEQSVAQTVAAQLADETEGTQPLETPEPSAMMIDEDTAQHEEMGPCQLVFVSEQGGVWDLLALDFNTRQLWQLTAHDRPMGEGEAVQVSVSPDGEQIAFNADMSGSQGVYVMERDGNGVEPVGFNPGWDDAWPSWSPDGGYLVFGSNRDGEEQIYMMDITGGEQERVTFEEDEFRYPALSPDGERIAMVSQRDGGLYVLDFMAMQLSNLSEQDFQVGPPSWSPDGERLVFSVNLGASQELFVVDVATGERMQLTGDGAENRFPAWSPDGEWIAFSSDWDGQMAIYLIPATGGEVLRLTEHDRQDLAKTWLPGCADELPGLLAGWDRDAPLAAGDPVPAIPGPGEADPVDPPTDDPADPPADDPVDPPADDPVDPPEGDPVDPPVEDEATTPEVTGNPIIDVVLDWARQIGQRIGLIPLDDDEGGRTVWEDLLELIIGSEDDPVGGGIAQETTATVTPDVTPTIEMTPSITPTQTDLEPVYFVYHGAFPGYVSLYGINCSGFAGTWHLYAEDTMHSHNDDFPSDSTPPIVDVVEPIINLQVTLPDRSDPGPCSSETDCDWESEPFDVNFIVRHIWENGHWEKYTQNHRNVRLVFSAYEPGVSASMHLFSPNVEGQFDFWFPPRYDNPPFEGSSPLDHIWDGVPTGIGVYDVLGPESRQRAFSLIARFCD